MMMPTEEHRNYQNLVEEYYRAPNPTLAGVLSAIAFRLADNYECQQNFPQYTQWATVAAEWVDRANGR